MINSFAHNTLKKYIQATGMDMVVDFDRSYETTLVDKHSGKEYLDCFGHYASLPLGYNHPYLKQHQDRLARVAREKIVNSDLYSEEYAAFVDTFFTNTLPTYFKYGFFIEGGSAAVENALKTAFDWKLRKSFSKNDYDNPEVINRLDIIHFKEAFHGRGGYTLSLTNTSPEKTKHFPKWPWTRVENPKIQLDGSHAKLEDDVLNKIEDTMKKGYVAAVIIEPIQGEGGHNMFAQQFLSNLRNLTYQYDSLLIFDEVQTGFGGTGKWWCHEHYGVQPDIMSFGKKTQVCGIVCTDRLDEVEKHCFKEPSRICSTWGGNIVDMVRCTLIMEAIVQDKLLQQVTDVGGYLMSELNKLDSNLIQHVRGLGTLVGFDLPDTETRNRLLSLLNQHMIILPCGTKTIRFRPSLNFTKQNVDMVIHFLKTSIAQL